MANEQPSKETLANWPTVEQALEKAEARVGPTSAEYALWALKGGLIGAYAMRSSSKLGQHGVAEPRFEPLRITLADWARCAHLPSTFDRGEVTLAYPRHGSSDTYVTCFDIRLDPVAVEREFPDRKRTPIAASPPQYAGSVGAHLPDGEQAEPRNLGGAPKKEFWDEMWVAIFGQLWSNKLVPEKQSDIETAMLDWAEKRGHKLGETTVKKPAQKLFRAYKTWV
jgi:hypothetical protein